MVSIARISHSELFSLHVFTLAIPWSIQTVLESTTWQTILFVWTSAGRRGRKSWKLHDIWKSQIKWWERWERLFIIGLGLNNLIFMIRNWSPLSRYQNINNQSWETDRLFWLLASFRLIGPFEVWFSLRMQIQVENTLTILFIKIKMTEEYLTADRQEVSWNYLIPNHSGNHLFGEKNRYFWLRSFIEWTIF